MPRFLNDRSTTWAASLSTPGRIFGSASSTVTWVPRSDIIEANSQPIAPPPMTTAVAGTSGIDSTSSEVMTILPSMSKPGMVRTSEPAAMITASPVTSTRSSAPSAARAGPDSPPEIVTRRPSWSRP